MDADIRRLCQILHDMKYPSVSKILRSNQYHYESRQIEEAERLAAAILDRYPSDQTVSESDAPR